MDDCVSTSTQTTLYSMQLRMDIEQAIDHRTFFVWEREPPLRWLPFGERCESQLHSRLLDFAVFSLLPMPVAKQAEEARGS
jgi:hypothetical protein